MRFNSTKLSHSVVFTGLFLFVCIGCGSGTSPTTSSTTVPQPTQPTPAVPPVPAGWVNLDRTYFSFSYPNGWQINETISATKPAVDAAESGLQHQFLVQFDLSFVNQTDITKQCARVDSYLVDFYNTNFLPLATDPSKFPNTTTTYSLPDPGPLGGETIIVSVVSVDKNGGVVGDAEYYVEAVPHQDGIYLVLYRHPSEPLNTWVSSRNTFLGTILFKSAALPSTAQCNYKG